MLSKITNLISVEALELVDNVSNKIGLSSIITTVGITTTQEITNSTPWALVDYALMISMVGGVLFIIEKLIVIYIRYKQKKLIEAEAARRRDGRYLP